MMKKSIMFVVGLVIIGGTCDVWAAPSVRKLGTSGVSAAAVKTTGVMPKQSSSEQKGSAALQAKVAKTPTAKIVAATAASTQRIPTISAIKPINAAKTKQEIINTGGVTPGAAGITDIESTDGRYVIGLEKQGTGLHVEKTDSVILPVMNGSYEGEEDGEIWLVE